MQENIENREENHMEKHNGNSRQAKTKFGVLGMSTRGGGIEKAIALGGALAVASLIAAFSITKSSNKDNNKNKTNASAQEEDANLHQNLCCTGMTETEASELVSTQSLITLGSLSDQQETLVHDAKQDSNEMKGNLENESNVIANLEMETFEITIVDKAMDVVAKQPALQSSVSRGEEEEEISPMRSSFSIEDDRTGEEEEYSPKESTFSTEEDENGGNVSEVDQESSEGTWSSSNMEVIWPAEMMDMNVSKLESEMKYKEEDIKGKIETYDYDGKKNKKVTVMDVRKGQQSAKRQTWVWFGLVVLMLGVLANILLQSNILPNNVSFVFPMK